MGEKVFLARPLHNARGLPFVTKIRDLYQEPIIGEEVFGSTLAQRPRACSVSEGFYSELKLYGLYQEPVMGEEVFGSTLAQRPRASIPN
jgi:hypothetical protein